MSYAFYEIDGELRGYGVECKCQKEGCKKEIDKGQSYLCYGCTGFFCEDHRDFCYDDNDEMVEFECYAGVNPQVCVNCAKERYKENTQN